MDTDKTPQRVPIRELVTYYLRLGLLGFGGPVALVGQMERELVDDKRWLKVSSPVLVAATAVIGLIAFPLLKPEWVFVK